MRWAKLAIVGAVAAAGCSSGGGGSESGETARPTADTGSKIAETRTPPGGDVIDSGPILVVATAHDVGQDGVPVDPALEFGSSDEQITVVVLVGDVEPGVALHVAWTWLDGPDGEQSLFEHAIDVGVGDVAYSRGIASGPLAAGRYRATVSLGESTEATVFAVRPDPITFPELTSGFARAPDPEAPAPPSSGPSGTIPAPRENTVSGTCQPWVQATSLLAMTGADRCGDNEFEVTAWVGDNSPVGYGRWIGDFIKPVRADPCDLGGSDLETEPISYAVTVIAGPEVGKLFRKTGPAPEPDTNAPMAFVGSEPTPGAQVSAGDVIAIEITADDQSAGDSVVTGIASVMLTTDTGQQVDGWEFEGPVACDKSRLRRVVRLEYEVPENPSELVKLVATVSDYQGNETTLEATYPTVGLWTGYMDVVGGTLTAITIGGDSVRCTTGWEFRVVVFAPTSGELYGYAERIGGTPESCDHPFTPIDSTVSSLGVSGTITPDDITLRFEHRDGDGYGISMLYKPPLPEIALTRSGNLAYGDINLSVTTQIPNNTFTEDLTGRIDLVCDEC